MGAAAAGLLARAGVGRLTLVDRDFVEPSNLQRQVLFDEDDARQHLAGTKPVAEQYPAEGFLDRLVARGLTFTTASDAHSLERVGSRAGELADLLEARGVHEVATYSNRQRQMIPVRAS